MNNQTIGTFIQNFYVKNGKFSIFLEQRAVELWSEVVGDFIAKQTTKITTKQSIIYATIPNAALRFEVMGRRSQIMENINKKLGSDVIKGIIVR